MYINTDGFADSATAATATAIPASTSPANASAHSVHRGRPEGSRPPPRSEFAERREKREAWGNAPAVVLPPPLAFFPKEAEKATGESTGGHRRHRFIGLICFWLGGWLVGWLVGVDCCCCCCCCCWESQRAQGQLGDWGGREIGIGTRTCAISLSAASPQPPSSSCARRTPPPQESSKGFFWLLSRSKREKNNTPNRATESKKNISS